MHSRQDNRRLAHLSVLILVAAIATACSNPTSPSSTETTTTTTTTQEAPTVTGVSPNSGSADGGTEVTVTGTGFTNVAALSVGGTAITSYTVASDTSITLTTPSASPGVFDVVVTTAGGSSEITDADWFELVPNVLTDLSLSAATVAPGLPVRGTVSVTFPAPSSGLRIPLTWSSSPGGLAAALYPQTAFIVTGATSGTFQVTTFFVSSPVTLQLSAEHGGQTKGASVVIGP